VTVGEGNFNIGW